MSRAEAEFHTEVLAGVRRLQKEIGYNPTRFRQMVGEIGALATARALVRSGGTSDGFTTLWEARRLDQSIEATMLEPWYGHLFTDDELRAARARLEEHGFDVDGFIHAAAARRPAWAAPEGVDQNGGEA